MGSMDTRVVSSVWPAATRLPAVISARPTRPEIGARTCVKDRSSAAASDGGFGRRDIGRRLFIARGARVELFLRNGALLDESRGALALGLRQRRLRARAGQLGLRLLERRLVGARIDDIENVAGLDLVTLLELAWQ